VPGRAAAIWNSSASLRGDGHVGERMESSGCDLILMDVQTPVMDGLTATRALRRREADEQQPRVPIIAMTANAISSDRDACLEAGMDDYLAKPFNSSQVSEVLGRWLP